MITVLGIVFAVWLFLSLIGTVVIKKYDFPSADWGQAFIMSYGGLWVYALTVWRFRS